MAAGFKTGGRQKGTPNKTTRIIKEAMLSVYEELQASVENVEQADAHFLQWAKDNSTEFYKLAAKLLPLQVTGEDGDPIEVITRIELIDGDGED